MNQALEALVRARVDALGFDLVELRRGGTARKPLLDVRIDRREGSKVSVDDCALVSRALEPELEASGLVRDDYVLEVSSPGLERPLRSAADWRRFARNRWMTASKSRFWIRGRGWMQRRSRVRRNRFIRPRGMDMLDLG